MIKRCPKCNGPMYKEGNEFEIMYICKAYGHKHPSIGELRL